MPVLDTLDAIGSLPLQDGACTGNVDSVVAEILFRAGIVKVISGRDADIYSKTPQFSEFYERFKQMEMYRDMEQVRQAQKASSAR